MNMNIYSNPLAERYSSKEMLENFSPDKKFSTWRKLWIALADSEKELGLHITDEQIAEMKANIYNIDYAPYILKSFYNDYIASYKETNRKLMLSGRFLINARQYLIMSVKQFCSLHRRILSLPFRY